MGNKTEGKVELPPATEAEGTDPETDPGKGKGKKLGFQVEVLMTEVTLEKAQTVNLSDGKKLEIPAGATIELPPGLFKAISNDKDLGGKKEAEDWLKALLLQHPERMVREFAIKEVKRSGIRPSMTVTL